MMHTQHQYLLPIKVVTDSESSSAAADPTIIPNSASSHVIFTPAHALMSCQVNTASHQSSTPTPPDDSFWDKRNTEATSASANARAKLLSPAHPSALTPGPPVDPSQAGPSTDGAAVQSPFGLVGSTQPAEGNGPSSQPHQTQVGILLLMTDRFDRYI